MLPHSDTLSWFWANQSLLYPRSHQQLLRKMRRKISWTDGRTNRGKTVYPPPPSGSGGIIKTGWLRIRIMCPSGATCLFADCCFSILLVAFFSVTIDARYLIFCHKLHIGTPYCGKCFLDPSDSYFLFVDFVDFYTHLTYICNAHFSSHFSTTVTEKNATKNILDGRKDEQR
jgi:hypothetical protein